MEKAGLTKRATCYTLKDWFATHLIEAGSDILAAQEFSGCKDVRIDHRRPHVLSRGGRSDKSPVGTL